MRELTADLWALHADGAAVAITTSGLVGKDGLARLGRGCARQAGERFPWLAARLGEAVAAGGNHVHHLGDRIASFPVEHDPFQVPEVKLLARSAAELASLADARGWTRVALPRPGCGFGGLSWSEVKPAIEPHLDDRFLVVALP